MCKLQFQPFEQETQGIYVAVGMKTRCICHVRGRNTKARHQLSEREQFVPACIFQELLRGQLPNRSLHLRLYPGEQHEQGCGHQQHANRGRGDFLHRFGTPLAVTRCQWSTQNRWYGLKSLHWAVICKIKCEQETRRLHAPTHSTHSRGILLLGPPDSDHNYDSG